MEALINVWENFFQSEQNTDTWWMRKKTSCHERQTRIVRIRGEGRVYHTVRYEEEIICHYLLHLAFFMKQKDHSFYIEELVLPVQCRLVNEEIVDHQLIPYQTMDVNVPPVRENDPKAYDSRFTYDRRAAVQYAERWWDSYNPDFRQFTVDCTNYVSQCLLAGGAPMRGGSDRSKGWWYRQNDWSYSWSVAHSMRWYLSGSTEGLQGKEVDSPEKLNPGDVICYDFEGDGRWDHTTIVVSKDANNMPLVNAHTDNSRQRYWSYEDSTAWTPQMKYKFFQIGISS